MKTEIIKSFEDCIKDLKSFIPYTSTNLDVISRYEKSLSNLKELSESKEIVRTEVIETENGHCVKFIIGCQSFKMEERPGLKGEITSFDHAKWYEKQLNTAFDTLLK